MKIITISGGVGKDAELRRTKSGDPVAGFSVAVNGRKKDDPPTWFDVSLWGKRGESLAQYITKGTKVTVVGEFGTREYEGKTYLTVNASEIALQGGGQSNVGEDYRDKKPSNTLPDDDVDLDSIPF